MAMQQNMQLRGRSNEGTDSAEVNMLVAHLDACTHTHAQLSYSCIPDTVDLRPPYMQGAIGSGK